jgi:ABC-type siderophore export system fused ATPase/permease subunit
MKFSTGFLTGAAVGGYLIYNMTPQQRERVASKATSTVDKVRSSSIVNSISNNISDVAGATSDRVADVVDTAGSAIADTVGPHDDNAPDSATGPITV